MMENDKNSDDNKKQKPGVLKKQTWTRKLNRNQKATESADILMKFNRLSGIIYENLKVCQIWPDNEVDGKSSECRLKDVCGIKGIFRGLFSRWSFFK